MDKDIFKTLSLLTLFIMFFGVTACSSAEKKVEPQAISGGAKMEITSAAFTEGSAIPAEFTADGVDVSPPLKWGAPPAGTKSLALICDDPDAPMGTWVHWVVWNLPPTLTELPKGIAHGDSITGGGIQGKNGSGTLGYNGPAPPSGTHHYFFKVYGLDTELTLPAGANKADLVKAMEGHIIGQGELMGRYSRNR